MGKDAEQLMKQVMELPIDERRTLILRLVQTLDVSLGTADEDSLTPSERDALHSAIAAAWQEVLAGKGRPAADVLADLRKQ